MPPIPTPTPPSVFPIDSNPKPLPKPTVDPPVGLPTTFVKPGGGTDVKPLVPETHPKTGFDVDLYDPKGVDSYESISLDYYNDKRFATALRAFNNYKQLQGGHYVEIPPIHVLKKKFPGQVGVIPVGGTSGAAPTGTATGAADWGAPKPETPARTPTPNRGTYIVPAGGWTMVTLARQFGVKWDDIWGLNQQYNPSDPLAAGTELRMPPNAKLP